jgi:DNA (cytosine-5)-methyltransferase 1
LREKSHQINLITAVKDAQSVNPVKLWPTPTRCNDSIYVDKSPNRHKRNSRGLASEVEHRTMWPTPNARDWKDSVNTVPPSVGKTRGHTLGMKVAERMVWPTPRAAKGMSMTLTEGIAKLHKKSYLESTVAHVESAPGGQLNPTWVEWLMGYPTGWTDLSA